MALHAVELPPEVSPASATMVMLHGFGASEEDLLPLGEALDPRLKVIALRAPLRLPWGGFAWYPLVPDAGGISMKEEQVEAAIAQATEAIEAIGKREGSPPILLGFSQGGGIATSLALRRPELVRAVISLSGVPPQVAAGKTAPREKLKVVPFFAAHGTRDQILPMIFGKTTRATLEHAGCDLSWHEYEMGHEISNAELIDLRTWLNAALAKP